MISSGCAVGHSPVYLLYLGWHLQPTERLEPFPSITLLPLFSQSFTLPAYCIILFLLTDPTNPCSLLVTIFTCSETPPLPRTRNIVPPLSLPI